VLTPENCEEQLNELVFGCDVIQLQRVIRILGMSLRFANRRAHQATIVDQRMHAAVLSENTEGMQQ
jgi:hypothetical protein